ncbi:hypothetical protein [Actinosynnema pretiosum]|uniref:Uncharacterized protein n=1 Tax=Actinosynnema pretiosum TaxID=42197 RepID=A0A290YZA7_9PSEU|nr:hypothetical protein [Actinosynnema pretiosum]ATE52111.1 hypothetical protein CNX65_01410 [Actinosynnema pretiosum]
MVPHGPDQRERLRCADCNATPARTGHGPLRLRHAASCPIAADDRATAAADLEWLADNPGQARDRAPSAGELELFRVMGGTRRLARRLRVHVTAVRGGRGLVFHRDGVAVAATVDLPGGAA